MRKRWISRLLFGFLITGWVAVNGQSNLESEVPGDNFSLEGALELFKKSSSPEEFEKKLNSPDSKVNNLDLNNDKYIDYIRVIDKNRGNVHAFILQAVLSENESQDVAVIELEKLDNGKAVLQITGDADVYGIETIIEPTEEVRVNAGTTTVRNVVNVWTWPSVQYVYGPYYNVWVSPWHWAYQPFWWRPWRPVAYYVYDPWWRPYRPYYSVCHTRRSYYAYEIYRPYRTTSVIVHNHYGPQIDRYRSNYNSGHGRDRYDSRGRSYSEDGRGRDTGRNYSDSRSRYTSVDQNFDKNTRTRNSYNAPDRRDAEQRYQSTDARVRNQVRTTERDNSGNDFKTFRDRPKSTPESGFTRERKAMTETRTPERTFKSSREDVRSLPDNTQRSNFQRKSAPERSSQGQFQPQRQQFQPQRQSNPSVGNSSRQRSFQQPSGNQRSSGGFERKSGSNGSTRNQRGGR